MKFESLVRDIQDTSVHLQQNAAKAVNIQLTLRNWLVGFFIVEFEQKGEDRAAYGSKLLQELSDKINIKGLTAPELSRCRQFYNIYPSILTALQQNEQILPYSIRQILVEKLSTFGGNRILGLATQESTPILGLPTQELQNTEFQKDESNPINLLTTISYTHFTELIKIEDEIKRKFYELLILKTIPSVKELKRQIETLAFERAGLSSDTKLAFEQLKSKNLFVSKYLLQLPAKEKIENFVNNELKNL